TRRHTDLLIEILAQILDIGFAARSSAQISDQHSLQRQHLADEPILKIVHANGIARNRRGPFLEFVLWSVCHPSARCLWRVTASAHTYKDGSSHRKGRRFSRNNLARQTARKAKISFGAKFVALVLSPKPF